MVYEYGMAGIPGFGGQLGTNFLQVKIAGNFFDDLFRDGFGVFDERADQGMFTNQIDNPGNASGVAMHNFNRR